jgi:GH43 family beta-xylosidase
VKVFEYRVVRRMFGCKKDEIVGGWRKKDNGELNNLYILPNIIRMIKSKWVKWVKCVEHSACMGGKHTQSLIGNTYRMAVTQQC